MIAIRRSPVGLVIKIIIVEVLIELTYLLLSAVMAEIRGNVGEAYASSRIIMSLIFMSLAICSVIILVSHWVSENYHVTENELIVRRGVIAKTEVAYPFINMQSIVVKQGVLGRVFNYGQLHIATSTMQADIFLSDVADAHKISETIRSHIPYPDNTQFVRRQ